jgi:hypothetical protein
VPAGVDPETGEIVEGEFTEAPDPAEEPDPAEPQVVDPRALEEAAAFVASVADENGVKYDDVLTAWNTDIFGVAADLDAYRKRVEARRQKRAGAAS